MTVSVEVVVTYFIKSPESAYQPIIMFERTLTGATLSMYTPGDNQGKLDQDIDPEDARALAQALLAYADGSPLIPDDKHQAFSEE